MAAQYPEYRHYFYMCDCSLIFHHSNSLNHSYCGVF